MNRKILFRGKRTDNGEWVYGDLLQFADGRAIIHSYVSGARVSDEVDPATVGQFTGLVDKNGVKIFEGDIVRHHNDHPDAENVEKGAVYWDEKYFGLRRTSNGAFHHGVVDTYRMSNDCVYEVIGNIHDHPSLLQG